MQKPSKKHHYLPRHYLRGFTDSQGRFFVYDKQTGNYFSAGPDALFFENNLNTVTFPDGSPSDFLEELYARLESSSWGSLDRIRRSYAGDAIDNRNKIDIFLFLLLLHWRLPSNAGFAEQLSRSFFGSEEELGFLRLASKTGTAVPQDIIDEIRTSPAWAKTARLVLPFAPFFRNESWFEDLARWCLVYPTDGKSWFVVGDNPIITRGSNDHDPIKCLKEFICPVSATILVISRGTLAVDTLPPEFTIQYGTAIIERSKRFVVSQDKAFLEALVSLHQLYMRDGSTDRIMPDLFAMLEVQD